MAFINEYISEEDIEKYDLKKLIEKYKRYTYSPDLDNINWTIDKENDIWLVSFGREHDPEMDHGFTREHIFVLHYKGHIIEARLWLEKDSSFNLSTRPYLVNWKLLSLTPNNLNEIDMKLIKNILCDALKIYGNHGIYDKKKEGLIEAISVSCRNFEECCL
jgi:hypothetical protein